MKPVKTENKGRFKTGDAIWWFNPSDYFKVKKMIGRERIKEVGQNEVILKSGVAFSYQMFDLALVSKTKRELLGKIKNAINKESLLLHEISNDT